MVAHNLNSKQQEAVESSTGPLLIIAGAGSGKTKTLTSRLEFLLQKGVKPESIIAITFTNKAADEMIRRIYSPNEPISGKSARPHFANMPYVGTFHSLGAKILRVEASNLSRNANYTIYDSDDSLSAIKRTIKKLALSKKDLMGPSLFRHYISKIKSGLLIPADVIDDDKIAILKLVAEEYENELLRNNAFDFDDLIEKPVRLWREFPNLLQKYQSKYQYILVDEFQDVNTAQYEFVRLLAKDHKNINVVGDDAQAIYGFRSANYKHFLNFERDWPEVKVVFLEENYRSTSTILDAANAVITNNLTQKPKRLWTQNQKGGLLKVKEHDDEVAEAEWIAGKLKPSADNNESVAVLYRTNAQSRAIEQALIERDIQYKIFGSIRFYERKEIKDIVACLRYAANPKDAVSVDRMQKSFYVKPFRELVIELPPRGKSLSPYDLIIYSIKTTNFFEYLKKNYPNAEERIENLEQLMEFSEGYKELPEFLEKISLLQSSDKENSRDEGQQSLTDKTPVVSLMTIHIAKGLEFDKVFVVGVNEGLLPHQMSYGTSDEIEEERRLMYVAMTRAKKDLFLSFYDLGSRFLYEIPPELIEFESIYGKNTDFVDDEERYIDID